MRNSHRKFNDRLKIENSLKQGKSFKEIGGLIGKSSSTVSKGVKLHRYEKPRNISYCPNICRLRADCDHSAHCQRKGYDRTSCRK